MQQVDDEFSEYIRLINDEILRDSSGKRGQKAQVTADAIKKRLNFFQTEFNQ